MEILNQKGGEIKEVTEEQKSLLKDRLEGVFQKGGFVFISEKTLVEGDKVTMDGSALLLGINPIRAVETIVGTLNLQPQELAVLLSRLVDNAKAKEK